MARAMGSSGLDEAYPTVLHRRLQPLMSLSEFLHSILANYIRTPTAYQPLMTDLWNFDVGLMTACCGATFVCAGRKAGKIRWLRFKAQMWGQTLGVSY
jgi:hypothetical protein